MVAKSTLNFWATAALVGMAALLSACGGGGGTTSVFTPPLPATGSVQGNVLDANTGAPVAGATVQTAGQTATTAADGKFTFLALDPAPRQVLTITASNYAAHSVATPVVANTSTNVSAQLTPLGTSAVVDLTSGGTVTVPSSPGQVVVPAGNPATCTGSAVVSVTPINSSLNPGFLPGDFSVGGSTLPLESFGAVTVGITIGGVAVPASANCNPITIRIPASSRASTLPTLLPLYSLDSATARWVSASTTASLGGTAPNQYYEATVSRAGTWSVDQPYETINATGCVADSQGARIAGVRVTAEGIDYTSTTSTDTDNAGNFSLPMKKSARAAITARSGGKTTNSVAAGPSAVDVAAGCLVLTDQSNNVTIRLTWGEAPVDADAHLRTPGGEHIYFEAKGDLTVAPFANLDVDDTTSFGPEIVTVRKLQVGTYTYQVNNFSRTFGPGLTESPTRVELNVGGNTTAYVPPAGEGSALWWTVFSFSVDALCRVTVTPVNTWSATEPVVPPAGGAVTYCAAP